MKRVCVFLGSSVGARPEYAEAARRLARELVARSLVLVYGGGNVGLMGIVADEVLAAGGDVIGVIPDSLVAFEVAHEGLPELHIVGSMHERKALMADLSDAFVTLPGGLGTFEECFEILTWAQLGMHGKPCGMLDVCGYYGPLREQLDRAVAEGFLRDENRGQLIIDDDPARLLDRFAEYAAPSVEKWIGRESI